MLRIIKIDRRYPSKLDAMHEDGLKEVEVTVTLEAKLESGAFVEVQLTMPDRETDDQLVAEAMSKTRDAIATVHTALQK